MPEKKPEFTVTDRRKFTAEGELREEETAARPDTKPAAPATDRAETAKPADPSSPAEATARPAVAETPAADEPVDATPYAEPTEEETAEQTSEYHRSARKLDDLLGQAAPGSPASAPMNFDRLVQSIYLTAAVQMGAGGAPGEQARVDIVGARQSIDMLGVLEDKTKGNLTVDEKRLLQQALFDLRMMFLEITNAISNAAHKPPTPGPVR